MTNTLHRYGKAEAFRDDYIIFAIPSKGKNDQGALEKLKTFLGICVRHHPANIGASGKSSFRPSPNLNPSVHWKRDLRPDFGAVIDGVKRAGTVGAVFDSRDKAVACLREVIDADLGLSVNVSTSVEGARGGRPCMRNPTTQRRVLVGVHRPARPPAQEPDSRAGHDVRPWHGLVPPGPEDGRHGPGGPPNTGAGCGDADPLLPLRRVQSIPRFAAFGRGPSAAVVRSVVELETTPPLDQGRVDAPKVQTGWFFWPRSLVIRHSSLCGHRRHRPHLHLLLTTSFDASR